MNDFLVFGVVFIVFLYYIFNRKRFKKFIAYDCFAEIACHCLNMNANFHQFKGTCLKHFDKKNSSNSVFVIINASEHIVQQSLFHVTYIACYKDFLAFQIELFIKTDYFELTLTVFDWTREYQIQVDCDDDFVYKEDIYLNNSDDIFDSSEDDENVKVSIMSLRLLFHSHK